MTGLKESLKKAAQEWDSIEPTNPLVLRLDSDIDKWADDYIKELEAALFLGFPQPDHLPAYRAGFEDAAWRALKFLKEGEEGKQEKSTPIDELLWPDRKAFLGMKNSLLADPKYAGKYVAILDSKLIDSDDDQGRLAKRVYGKYGYRRIYMSKVEREEPVYRIEAASSIHNKTEAHSH